MLRSSIHFIPNCPEARDLVERSLTDLQTDCLDLIQVYTWSRAWNQDPTVFEEWVDTVQLICNIFSQEAQEGLFAEA